MAILRTSKAAMAPVLLLAICLVVLWPRSHVNEGHLASKRSRSVSVPSDAGYENGLVVLNWTQYNENLHGSDSSESVHLWRRAPPQTYEEAVAKGRSLIRMLETPTDCIVQSTYAQYGDLATYGWDVEDPDPEDPDPADDHEDGGLADAQLDLHVGPNQRETTINYVHSRSTTPGTIQYPATDASYKNAFDYVNGIIYATGIFGPDFENSMRETPIPPASLVPLRKWSDVVFLAWQELCRLNGADIRGLHAIVQSDIINEHTQAIVAAVVEAGGLRMQDMAYPGRYYAKGTDHFAALLATPNVLGTAFLLFQHRIQLGWKDILGIRFYCDDCEIYPVDGFGLYMIIYLGNVDPQQQQQWTQQNGQTGPARRHATRTLSRRVSEDQLPPKDSKYADFQGYVEGGKGMVERMNAASNCVPQSQWTQLGDLEKWGWKFGDVSPGEPLDEGVHHILGRINQPAQNTAQDNSHFVIDHVEETKGNGQVYLATHAKFEQWFNTHAIFAMNVQGCKKMGASRGVTGDPNPFPPISQLSDVTYLEWFKFHNGDLGKIQDIRAMCHMGIINKATIWVVNRLKAKAGRIGDFLLPDTNPFIFEVGSDGLAALLATPNGAGVGWFLAQHKDQLTRKEIYRVQIWSDVYEDYSICFFIRPNQQPLEGNVGKIRRSANETVIADLIVRGPTAFDKRFKVVEDESDLNEHSEWDQAVVIGNHLLGLVMAPVACVQQSIWTTSTDLAGYGWVTKKTEDMPLSNTDIFGPSFGDMFRDLGLSTRDQDLHWVDLMHDRDTTHNGRVYRKTEGRYQNVFNPLGVFVDYIYSPDEYGQWLDPPVTGRDVVPLKTWADVVFLQWVDYCNGNVQRIQAIRYMMQLNVVNDQSKRVIEESIRRSGRDANSVNRGWADHLSFDINTAHAQAIIATANGIGAAWFLAQHKVQLGQKSIVRVIVLRDPKKWHLVFEFGPGPAPRQFQQMLQLGGPPIVHATIGNTANAAATTVESTTAATKTAKRSIHDSSDVPGTWTRFSRRTQAFDDALKRGSNLLRAIETPTPNLNVTYLDAELSVLPNLDWTSNITRFVTNEETNAVIQEVVWRLQGTDEAQPRLHVSARHAEGQALLGTDVGIEVVEAVAQAARARVITHVTIFDDPEGFILGFHLKDAGHQAEDTSRVSRGLERRKGPRDDQSNDRSREMNIPTTSRTSPSKIHRQAGKPQSYDDYVLEGTHFLCSLYAPIANVAQSKWTDPFSLKTYGWTQTATNGVNMSSGNSIPMGAVFKDPQIGLDSADAANLRISIRQDTEVTVGGTLYNASRGSYINVFNAGPKKGAILGDTNYGPDVEGARQQPPVTGKAVVPLKQWSDVVFLQWQQLIQGNHRSAGVERDAAMQRLDLVFRLRIDNANTNSIIGNVMSGEAIGLWPGKLIDMGTDQGKAMLATPHGAGVSWMLAQHKAQLGRKVVTGVTVFTHQLGHKTSLCFWLKDWSQGMEVP